MSEPNVTGIVELADSENHTIEPKITTLSYIQPELWQFQILKQWYFFRFFQKIQLNMNIHFYTCQKDHLCAEPRRLTY